MNRKQRRGKNKQEKTTTTKTKQPYSPLNNSNDQPF